MIEKNKLAQQSEIFFMIALITPDRFSILDLGKRKQMNKYKISWKNANTYISYYFIKSLHRSNQ